MAKRINQVDAAKGIGIILVYIGHWAEDLFRYSGDVAGFHLFKIIYSFHVPMFVLMSGIFFGTRAQLPFPKFFVHQTVKRLGYVLFFSLLMLPVWWLTKPDIHANIPRYLLWGHPKLAWPTWFLVALLVVEILTHPIVKNAHTQEERWIGVGIFLAVAAILDWVSPRILAQLGLPVNFWFINCIPWFGFMFLTGNALGTTQSVFDLTPRPKLWAIGGIFLLAGTYFNRGIDPSYVVMPVAGRIGDTMIFGLGVLGGTLLVWMVAGYCLRFSSILFIGRNSLIYLGLNSVFFHFIGPYVTGYLTIPAGFSLLLILVFSLLSLVAVRPFVTPVHKLWVYVIDQFNLEKPPKPKIHASTPMG